jgi:hypothetical protein
MAFDGECCPKLVNHVNEVRVANMSGTTYVDTRIAGDIVDAYFANTIYMRLCAYGTGMDIVVVSRLWSGPGGRASPRTARASPSPAPEATRGPRRPGRPAWGRTTCWARPTQRPSSPRTAWFTSATARASPRPRTAASVSLRARVRGAPAPVTIAPTRPATREQRAAWPPGSLADAAPY